MSPRGGRRPGAGRKPKPPNERRDNTVTIALTKAEFGALRELSGEEPLAVYVQRLVVRHVDRKRRAGRT